MGHSPELGRDSPFAYTCNKCMTCCHDAHIALDPYEIARLARNQNLTTTEFIARFLTEGGIVLRNVEDTSCVFLGTDGCTVYPDRPEICRSYPLKRLRGSDGEVFLQYLQFPASTGVYGKDGTVADFLKKQEADEFFTAKDRYYDLALRIAAVLAEAAKRKPDLFATMRSIAESRCEFHGVRIRSSRNCRQQGEIPALIDVDRVVSNYCRERKLDPPSTVDEKIAIHIKAIEEKLAAISARIRSTQALDADADRDLLEMAALAGALAAATEARVMLAFVDGVFGGRPSKTT
ncbi:MAG TPA: YkgJ family cysteine cluster protein [Candidatus Acidoferrum sp.]|nr:YkgJ family cysteine cluster protein [Candidatus Acidoferrum sp.]